MMDETMVRVWLATQRRALEDWSEPDGYLLPTEPDPLERERVRLMLQAQVQTLERILSG